MVAINYQYSVVDLGGEFAVRADHRQGQLVAFRTTEREARKVAEHLQERANSRFQ